MSDEKKSVFNDDMPVTETDKKSLKNDDALQMNESEKGEENTECETESLNSSENGGTSPAPETETKDSQKKGVDDLAERMNIREKMRRCLNYCGWTFIILIISWFTLSFFTIYIPFTTEYYMFFNELSLGIAILISFCFLKASSPKAPFQKKKVPFNHIMMLTSVCIAVGYIGNLISSQFIAFWNVFTNSNVTNEVSDIIMNIDLVQNFLFVGIVAPFLEEFFFRKLLIDRMRPYGELLSVIISSAFFALFHMNFSQLIYAFGVGLVLGCLYYRSDNYIAVTALHSLFNIVMGVIPTVFYGKIMQFFIELEYIQESSEIFSLFREYAVPLILYAVYAIAILALVIVGIVVFASNVKKVRPIKSEYPLQAEDYRFAVLKNPGIIIAAVIVILLTVSSLFV